MYKLKLLLLKVIDYVLVKLKRGTSLTGFIDQKYQFNVVKNVDFTNVNIIFVIGTNGKTTTSNLIYDILSKQGLVVANKEGANMLSGILTTLIKNINFKGQIKAEYLCLEVDEKSLKHVIKIIKPDHVVVTNFFRDQLDRYGEIDSIVQEIIVTLKGTDATLYLNGCDPIIVSKFSALKNKKYYFGLEDNINTVRVQKKTVELKYCPECKKVLGYDYYHYGHIGKFSCSHCHFSQKNLDVSLFLDYENNEIEVLNKQYNFDVKLFPQYFYFNIAASMAVIKNLNKLNPDIVNDVLKNFEQPKGRSQSFFSDGKKVYFNLAKNVVGFEETLEYVVKEYENFDLLICFNDKSADGYDVSWIWDVDILSLKGKVSTIYLTGLRRYDMALRFEMDDFQNIVVLSENVYNDTKKVLENKKNIVIISNYTPLLQVNNALSAFR